MPTPNSRVEPFVGYCVALATEADASSLLRMAPPDPTIHALLAGQRSITLPPRVANALYDAAVSASRAPGERFPLRFTPVHCTRGRALQFEGLALSATEILHLVHDGLYGSARCREAAIAAVQVCGVLPVAALDLPPLLRFASRKTAESHVDTLIDREAELHLRLSAKPGGSAA